MLIRYIGGAGRRVIGIFTWDAGKQFRHGCHRRETGGGSADDHGIQSGSTVPLGIERRSKTWRPHSTHRPNKLKNFLTHHKPGR